MLILGIPVLNNYNGLFRLIDSAEAGSVIPDEYWIIDNGNSIHKFGDLNPKIKVIYSGNNIGVAKSWNLFLSRVSDKDILIISNDDIILERDSLKIFIEGLDRDQFSCTSGVNAFSFFYLPKKIWMKVGPFDESLSPNYAYFEDNDYDLRLRLMNYRTVKVDIPIRHENSSTMKNYSQQELEEHHRKFRIARFNYIRKWGGLPGKELV